MPAPITKIPVGEVQGMIGQLVHVFGWNHSCVFRLLKLDGGVAVLRTKRRKIYRVPMTQLAYTRDQEAKLEAKAKESP
jgi:hypothetical protein